MAKRSQGYKNTRQGNPLRRVADKNLQGDFSMFGLTVNGNYHLEEIARQSLDSADDVRDFGKGVFEDTENNIVGLKIPGARRPKLHGFVSPPDRSD